MIPARKATDGHAQDFVGTDEFFATHSGSARTVDLFDTRYSKWFAYSFLCVALQPSVVGRLRLKCDGTRWRTGGNWRGNWRIELVASTLHTTSENGVSSITTADVHTSAACSRLNWRPRRFKWTRPFRRKTKSGFCACAITFQTQSTNSSPVVPVTVSCTPGTVPNTPRSPHPHPSKIDRVVVCEL
jgi:hypothetical protein